jgi:hypothetical protein
VCRQWFLPDRRLGARQRACSPACSAVRRQQKQAAWSKRNPDYWTARRLEAQVAKAESAASDVRHTNGAQAGAAAAGGLRLRPPPSEVAKVPWELVQDAFGVQGAVLIALILRLALRRSQDAMRLHHPEIKGDFAQHSPGIAQAASDSAGAAVLDC